mgnify:CR=1 FL=1
MKVIFTPYIYIVIFLLKISSCYTQEFQLKAISNTIENNKVLSELVFKKNHTSKKSIDREIDSILIQLEYKGFLNASLDSLLHTEQKYIAQFLLNNQTKWLKINYSNIPNEIIDKKKLEKVSNHVNDTYFEIPFSDVANSLQYIVDNFEQSGKSFIKLSLDHIHLQKDTAFANININETQVRTIDKGIIKGYENFPKNFITHELNLKTGSIFNKEKLEYVSTTINHISFVEEQKPPEVLFTNDSTYIYIYLKKKRSNKFDGILGFASKEEKSGLEFNGYLDLEFSNIFNSGEKLSLFWKNNGNDSQRFYISAETPYIFNLPIIPKVNFELFRQDSTFSNVSTLVDISYSLNKIGDVSVVFNTESSTNLLKNQTTNIKSFKNIFYGVAYNYENIVNDNLFPIRFRFNFSSFFGSREVENAKTNQSKFQLLANYIFSINKKNYLFLQNQSALLNSENFVTNELFRIGGTNNIRGVNEESILATSYSVFNLEYRFRPNFSSFFYSITDYAYIQDEIASTNLNILSLGIGYAFRTKIGLLNLSYAIGKFDNSSFNFDNSRLHIKIISFF